jgi:hypothetical protein
MRNRGKLAAVAALTLLLTTTATAMSAQPALAASCSGTGCNGQDPGATGCADSNTTNARTLTVHYYASANFWADMTVYLRWSPTCGTNWAKAVVTSSNPSNWGYQMAVELKDQYYNYVDGTYTGLANTRAIYGDMHYAPTTPMRACAVIDNFSGGWQCTAAG